jgi:hypothetical protein
MFGGRTPVMRGMRWQKLLVALGLICSYWLACAQVDQFLPEVNFYSKLRDGVRFQVQAKRTREANEPVQAEIGPSVDFYVHSWGRLAEIAKFDLDDAKSRAWLLSIGYRYLPEANGGGATNRIIPSATIRLRLRRSCR